MSRVSVSAPAVQVPSAVAAQCTVELEEWYLIGGVAGQLSVAPQY